MTLALPAFAQRPGGQGGRFGGGFGGTQSAGMLLGNEALQKELAITDDQKSKITTLSTELREKMQAGAPDFASIRDLPEAERNAKFAEMREKSTKVAEEFKSKFAEILTKEQNDRLQQIQWQLVGLRDESLLKALNVSAEQTEKLKKIDTESQAKIEALPRPDRNGGAEAFQERQTKTREITEEANKAKMEVLTSEQKDQLTKLKGKEFDVSALRPRFGGGGGPGGGRPGGAGGNRPERPE
jgi:hypothetical protein